ncbi:unnamed protein product, partial [Acidocella sp. C78]
VLAEAEREQDRLALLETALAGGLHAAGPVERISRLAVAPRTGGTAGPGCRAGAEHGKGK